MLLCAEKTLQPFNRNRSVGFNYVSRVKIGIILLVLFALFSNLRLLTDWIQFDLSFVGQDEVTLYQKRFDEVKKVLPSTGVIGFVTSNRNMALTETSTDGGALREWYMTQYVLAPVIVSPTPGHDLILINDKPNSDGSDPDLVTTQITPGGPVVKDFGNGVKLVRSR